MNKIYLAIIALLALTSCANTYEIKGTSNVSTLDGRMLYLKILKDNNFKSIDSCDVLHGQFHFQGNLDSVKMGNIFMDDEPVLPLVLESGDITVKLDDAQQIVSGTPLNDKLFGFFKKYQQLQNQQRELVHKHDQAIMNGSDMNVVTQKLNAEAIQLSEQEDKLITNFVTENFDNVLGAGVFFLVTMGNQYPMLSPWIEDIMWVFPACSSHAEACTFRFSKTVCSAAALSSRSFTSSARGKAVSGEISAPFVSK